MEAEQWSGALEVVATQLEFRHCVHCKIVSHQALEAGH